MRRQYLFGFIFFALANFCPVEAIYCFQCDSSNAGCENLTVADKTSPYYLACPEDDKTYFCRKTAQAISGLDITRIQRECGWLSDAPGETRCFKYNTEHLKNRNCQCFEDGCNAAPPTLKKWELSVWLLWLFVVVVFTEHLY